MKITKVANSTARRVFRLCQSNGRLDQAKLSDVVRRIAASKGRGYLGVLTALKRLVRLELERNHVVIESAAELDQVSRERVVSSLGLKYGNQLTFEYRITPELLGGLKIRVGNDVWDGTVKGRLDRLVEAF